MEYISKFKCSEIDQKLTYIDSTVKPKLSQFESELEKLPNIESELTELSAEVGKIYESNGEYNEVTDRESFQGVPEKSTQKFISSASQEVRTIYIPVIAGCYYRIVTTEDIYCPLSWIALSFFSEKPSQGVSVESIIDNNVETLSLNEMYRPTRDGYIGVAFNGNVSVLSARIKFFSSGFSLTTDIIKEDVQSIKEDVKLVKDELQVSTETEASITLNNYVKGMIMRVSSLKFESTSAVKYVVYIPIAVGKRYKVVTNTNIDGASWGLVGFSKEIPVDGGSYEDLYHSDTAGEQQYEFDYTPTSEGYLCVFFGNAIETLSERMQVYEYTSQSELITELLPKGMYSESLDAKDALLDAPRSFNIGYTNLSSITKKPNSLSIGTEGSNYNDVIRQYVNIQDGRKTSKLIPIRVHNINPNIGDFSTLGSTYWREVIGVDSEGWIYCAQRKYANLSTDANVNIYKTKDFETFEIFKAQSGGHQLVELENGELCLATHEVETIDGKSYIRCFIYVTSNNKTIFNKKFACTQISQYSPASPWSWGIQSRGSVVAIGEYGQHGQCGKVWYSRDYGETFYEVFDLRDNAPDVPHAHVHGICVDPYFDRLYIINGDGSPASSSDLLNKNSRIWYWDYSGEVLSTNLKNTITWKYANVGEDVSLGSNLQFVCGYALKDCILLSSDSSNNGIFRINRGKKEDVPTIDFAHHLGIETGFAKFCGGNMFRRNENSPLFVCMIREYSCDLEPDAEGNPSGKPNTYKDVPSRIYSTYDGFHFEEVWIDDTYGTYTAHYSDGTSEQRNLAKCGRDMSIWQLPSERLILKYLGRDFSYVAYNSNGVTSVTKVAYVDFANDVAEFVLK